MEKYWAWLVALVLLLALLLRLPLLGGSFWLDEAAQALESARPLSQQLNIQADFQPPLLHFIVHFALTVSREEWWLRSIGALLPGLLSVWGSILLARQLLPKNQALGGSLLVGLLLATNSFHLFYSQELRPYALPMSFAVWSWWLVAQKQHSNRIILGWSILSLLGLYSSYLYPFLLISQLIFLVAKTNNSQNNRGWLAGLLALVLGFAPWLPTFFQQLQAGQLLRLQLPNWESAVSTGQLKVLPLVLGKFIYGVLDLSVNQYYLSSFTFICLIAGFIAIGLLQQRQSKPISTIQKLTSRLLLFWFFVPLLTGWLISFFVPVIQPKRVIFLLPAFYLLIVWLFATAQTLSRWYRGASCALITLLLIINLFSVYQYYRQPQLQREDWRGMLALVRRSYTPSFTLSSFPAPFAPLEWYAVSTHNSSVDQDLATGKLNIESQMVANQIIQTATITSVSDNLIYFEYLTDLTDPNHYLRNAIESSGYRLQNLLDYPGIGFVRIYRYQQPYAFGD